ncbi:30S ribosomal protein S9 [Candidatus Bilamarchaeum dharawalense]|uniref:30S ribosomal protein S9 n=1 Tax=Candidatus Bilamarchaeum dharawalense TaxID=2885759 RepID=A0A5E4LR69_9ARCH|nr:30S ribosomal protein S9 [Candidatus Bilamarchaeum dharawalense]
MVKEEKEKKKAVKPKKVKEETKPEEKQEPKPVETHKHEEKHEHKESVHEVKHVEHKPEHHEVKPEPKPRKRKAAAKKPSKKVMTARGKRKESVARATITEGKGVIRVNSRNITSINNSYVREIIKEPLRYVGPEANNIDIAVNVNGGGIMGQAQAARTAIANALVAYFDGMNLKEKFISIDRSLVIEDTRRVEPKKFRGPKARARFQKSYR